MTGCVRLHNIYNLHIINVFVVTVYTEQELLRDGGLIESPVKLNLATAA